MYKTKYKGKIASTIYTFIHITQHHPHYYIDDDELNEQTNNTNQKRIGPHVPTHNVICKLYHKHDTRLNEK